MQVDESHTMTHQTISRRTAQWHLSFQSLFHQGRALAFPCDAGGHVDVDALSDRGRRNYAFARAMVGREFATPSLQLA